MDNISKKEQILKKIKNNESILDLIPSLNEKFLLENNNIFEENDWVQIKGKPYQIERLGYEINNEGKHVLKSILVRKKVYAVPLKDIEKKLPSYEEIFNKIKDDL